MNQAKKTKHKVSYSNEVIMQKLLQLTKQDLEDGGKICLVKKYTAIPNIKRSKDGICLSPEKRHGNRRSNNTLSDERMQFNEPGSNGRNLAQIRICKRSIGEKLKCERTEPRNSSSKALRKCATLNDCDEFKQNEAQTI